MVRGILLAITLGLAAAAPAQASCVCRCVDGNMRPMCDNAAEIPPICPATICRIPPAAIAPIKPPRVPPPGTFQCERRQVLNPATQQYVWRSLCQ